MEKTNLRAETDRIWVQVETLQWVLAQIRMLKAAYGQVVNLDMSVFKFVCFIALGKKRYYKLNPSYHSIFGLEIFEYR